MKILNKIKAVCLLLLISGGAFISCNKLEIDPTPGTPAPSSAAPTLAALLNDPSFSLLKAAVTRVGLMPALENTVVKYTLFAPDDNAIAASAAILAPGVPPAAVIASFDDATLKAILQYHIVPQLIPASSISANFPNFQYPTILNPLAANPAAALFRLTTFPSKRANGAWVNNIPITAVDIAASNGIVHKVAGIVLPPQIDLWAKIQTDPGLTYLKAAIARADNGVPAGVRLQDALSVTANSSAIGANLTLFAPTDAAMSQFVTGALTQAFIAKGIPAPNAQAAAGLLVTNFGSVLLSDPASIPDVLPGITGLGAQLAAVITPTLAKGIVAYHVISRQSGTFAPPGIRVFSVNMPSTATAVKTLLNTAVSVHPGVIVQATFASPFPGISVVTAATVKGAANATASNVIIGFASSDLNYLNGVMHKIDQVLLPQ